MRRFLKYILLVVLVLRYCPCTGQSTDSLKLALKNSKSDTAQIKILSELSELCEVEEIPEYAEPCIKLCEKGINTQPAFKLFYLKYLALALNNIGFLSGQLGDVPKALEYWHKSLKIQEEIKDKKGIANSLNNIGAVYYNLGDISQALECWHKSLKIREEIRDEEGIAESLNNIAGIYDDQDDIPKALEYYHKSLKIREKIKDKRGIANSLNNIGLIYKNEGDIPKALEYYHKSLKIKEEIKDKRGIATSLNNIGLIYNNLAEQQRSPDSTAHRERLLNKAFEYFHKSFKTFEEIKDKKGIAESLNNVGGVLLRQGKVNEALVFALRAMQTSKELGFPEQINKSASVLNKIYKKQNKFKDALEMYELEIQMRDSINNAETKKASIKKQFQYQYEKKAAADSVKNSEEQKVKNAQLTAQQAQLKQERTQRFALYGGLVIIIIFLAVVFNRFRITQKQKALIEKQKAEVDNAFKLLHEKNKEVMDSIYYARRIQRSLLPTESYIARMLSRSRAKPHD